MRDQSNVWPSLLTSMVIATLFFQAANSVDLRVFTPRLLELCVCYWILSSPGTVGIFFAFIVGLLISLIEGSFLGSASIGLSIVGFVLLNNIFTIRQLDWVSQTTVILGGGPTWIACNFLFIPIRIWDGPILNPSVPFRNGNLIQARLIWI